LISAVAVILGAVFLNVQISPGRAFALEADSLDRPNASELASLADEADLSRSADGETFEDDSHSLHDDLSGFESDHGLESEHEGLEGEHGGESEHGGGEDGGGDSGGDDGGGDD
jgi:hypothetical protein